MIKAIFCSVALVLIHSHCALASFFFKKKIVNLYSLAFKFKFVNLTCMSEFRNSTAE
jgi:hypothetical protein